MTRFLKFAGGLFVIANLVTIGLFLLSCCNIFLHPGRFWFIALLGLAFPLLLLAMLIFLVAGIFLRRHRRLAIITLISLVLGWTNIHSFFAFHPGKAFNLEKAPGSIRILTWNVRSFDVFNSIRPDDRHRQPMMDFIADQHPDIVCLQEFFDPRNYGGLQRNIPYMQEHYQYPYAYFSKDHIHSWNNAAYMSGVIIFSRYPIVDSLIRHYKEDQVSSAESVIAADIKVGDDTVRIFTTHLQSVLFHKKEFQGIENIKSGGDGSLAASKNIVRKLGYAFRRRGEQVDMVRSILDSCPYPGVICGDFNDVPNSYAYSTVRGKWKDAYTEKGFGVGRTYKFIFPTLRIDYILADPRLNILQCKRYSTPYSDHNPVVADLQLP